MRATVRVMRAAAAAVAEGNSHAARDSWLCLHKRSFLSLAIAASAQRRLNVQSFKLQIPDTTQPCARGDYTAAEPKYVCLYYYGRGV